MLALALLFLAYVAAGKLGLSMAFVHASASAVWPPTGLALGALLVGGYRLWPAILLGAFVVNVTTAGSVATSLGISAGNALEALTGAWLVNRFAGGRRVFERARDVFKFAALAAILSTMVSATIGVTSLALGGYASWDAYGAIWVTWWLGDAAGALIVTPLVVLWSDRPRLPDQRRLEVAAILLVTVGLATAVFWLPGVGLPFATIPPLIWAAFRLGAREAATLIVAISAIAVTATLRGLGPFAVGNQNTSLLVLQAFMGTIAGMTLPVAAIVAERRAISEERLRLLERARMAQTAAEDANRGKDQFLAMLSHELRTPLNSALGWASMLRQGRLDAASSTRAIETVERNIRLLARLIDDLIDLSRIAAGKLSVEKKPVEVASIVTAAAEAVRPAATASGITLDVALETPDVRVLGDGVRLQQVIWNLLSNAVKFTDRGGHITVRVTQRGAHARIQVIDTGRGITPELLPHVFERFRQAETPGARPHVGLGLGLAIVLHLVELHGGTVTAESAGEGRGSTFTIDLPLVSHGAPSTAAEAPRADSLGLPALHELCVLLVDDDPDGREMLAVVLETCGARAVAAESTEEALKALDHTRFDVMVADIGMAGRDGLDLIRTVRSRTDGVRRIPAIAFTAFAGPDDALRVIAAGYDLHVAKPVDPAALARAVASLAGRGESR